MEMTWRGPKPSHLLERGPPREGCTPETSKEGDGTKESMVGRAGKDERSFNNFREVVTTHEEVERNLNTQICKLRK